MPDELVAPNVFELALRGLIKQMPVSVQSRADGWANILSGLGTFSDKTTHTAPTLFCGLNDQALSAMFHGDATVRKIVGKRVRAALRTGFQVSVPEKAGADVATAIQDAADDLKAVGALVESVEWENLFGGAVIYIGVDDGQRGPDSQAQSIRVDTLRKVLWLKVIDRRYVQRSPLPEDRDLDPSSPTYGQPTHYQVRVQMGGVYIDARIHRDRLIILPGAATTVEVRENRSGWGISALDPVYDALQRNINAWQSAGNAVANAQYTVYALKGLSTMLSQAGGEDKMKARSKAMEMAKSMINAILIDADDKYTREKIDFGNLPEMLDRFMMDTASAADMPVTELFGRSAGGMNATGEGDREMWEASVEELREHHLRPAAQRIVELLLASKEGPTKGADVDGWRVTFKPLEMLSALEQADRYLKVATADVAYITNEVLTAAEVAQSRFRAEGYSTDTTVDLEARKAMHDAEVEAIMKSHELAANPPEPVVEPGDATKPPVKETA